MLLNILQLTLCGIMNRSSLSELFYKKGVLKVSQNWQENICARVSFLIKLQVEICIFIKKNTLMRVFSSEFWKIFKNIFFIKYFLCLLLYVAWTSSKLLPGSEIW